MFKKQVENLNSLSDLSGIISAIFIVITANRCVSMYHFGQKDEIITTLLMALFTILPLAIAIGVAALLRPLAVKICPGYKERYAKPTGLTSEWLEMILAVVTLVCIFVYRQTESQFDTACMIMLVAEVVYITYAIMTVAVDLFRTSWVAIREYAEKIEAEGLVETSTGEATEVLSEVK